MTKSIEDLASEKPKVYEALETIDISMKVIRLHYVGLPIAPDVRIDHLGRVERAVKFLKKEERK